jgi:hypothetical protein
LKKNVSARLRTIIVFPFTVVISIVSSTYCKHIIGCLSFGVMFYGKHVLIAVTILYSASTVNINNIRDNGSPCYKPRLCRKVLEGALLTRIEEVDVVTC